MLTYRTREVPCPADPAAAGAALCAAATEPFVLYENRGAVGWAVGALAAPTVHADGVRVGDRVHPGAPLTALKAALADIDLDGWRAYGWLSFDLAHALHTDHTPDGVIGALVIPRGEIRIADGRAELRAPDDAGLDDLEQRLLIATESAREPRPDRVSLDPDPVAETAYAVAVADAVAEIRAGLLDKVILSRSVPVPHDIDLPATYLAGRRGNDPARSFLLRLAGWEAAGFSPEIVVRVDPAGEVATQPLAGTRARTGTSLDVTWREELYRDAKEVFEHALSVRLAAVEMAGFCAPGSVRVGDFMSIKERGSVQHLASEVFGTLAPGADAWDAVAALFPAVTASGIPKREAIDLISRVEEPRGLYSGAVLTVDSTGAIDAALVLRTVFRRGGRTWLRAGAGVVAQSRPERELEETREKLRSVSRFLVPAHALVRS